MSSVDCAQLKTTKIAVYPLRAPKSRLLKSEIFISFLLCLVRLHLLAAFHNGTHRILHTYGYVYINIYSYTRMSIHM